MGFCCAVLQSVVANQCSWHINRVGDFSPRAAEGNVATPQVGGKPHDHEQRIATRRDDGGRSGGSLARCTCRHSGPAGAVGRHRPRRCRRHCPRCRRTGSRRVGDRGDIRSAGALHQDRRHGRSGPLRHSRPAQGQLRRVGTRLRTCRLAEGAHGSRQARQSDGRAGAKRRGSGAILSGRLLVLDAEDSRQVRFLADHAAAP
jgi:hypothetical protein